MFMIDQLSSSYLPPTPRPIPRVDCVDSLTLLPTGRVRDEVIDTLVQQPQLTVVSVLALKIDLLNAIRRLYGLESANQVLTKAAMTLEFLVPRSGVVMRETASHFLCFLPNRNEKRAAAIGVLLGRKLGRLFLDDGVVLPPISISGGTAQTRTMTKDALNQAVTGAITQMALAIIENKGNIVLESGTCCPTHN